MQVKSRSTLLVSCALSLVLLLGLATSASANSRTFIGAKYKGAVGDLALAYPGINAGLELEYRFDNGFAIAAACTAGFLKAEVDDGPTVDIGLYSAALGARYYVMLGDFNPYFGISGTALIANAMGASATLPGLQATAGLEMMFNKIRFAGEVGYEAFIIDKKLEEGGIVYGVSLGYCF